MKGQDSIGHLENEIHFQRVGVPLRLRPRLILQCSAARLEDAPFQNRC